MTKSKLVILVALFLGLFGNIAFFKNVTAVYPVSLGNAAFLLSLSVVLVSLIALLLNLVSIRSATKPILIVILLLSSFASYFMDSFNVVIDASMLQNAVQTNLAESRDLFSLKLIFYVLLLGVLPSVLVYKANLKSTSLKSELASKFKFIFLALLIIALLIIVFSKFYTSFFREHKPLRYYANPIYYLYAVGESVNRTLRSGDGVVKAIEKDAHVPVGDLDRELVILVVGEAARADRFSLNGYARETNPLLKKEEVFNLPQMSSCGTSTAVSVPCMFSNIGRAQYSDQKAHTTENLLDVLRHAGVHILWRDNNSDSKGVALNVPYVSYRSAETNPICDIECRDEGMLVGLQDYINKQKTGDILIVLHQMGNHGPAYYKRYPAAFERFKPVCKTSQLENCTREEISNAYDNAILYTDYFLSKVIALLKNNTKNFETAMFYMSDHGESLGENSLYLHGLPYVMAPDTQKHVGAMLWFGERFHIDRPALRVKSAKPYSHDHLFHTVLGLFEVDTKVYDKKMDIVHGDPR